MSGDKPVTRILSGKIENACLFDNNEECPVRKVFEADVRADVAAEKTLEKACPICPIRLKMLGKQ